MSKCVALAPCCRAVCRCSCLRYTWCCRVGPPFYRETFISYVGATSRGGAGCAWRAHDADGQLDLGSWGGCWLAAVAQLQRCICPGPLPLMPRTTNSLFCACFLSRSIALLHQDALPESMPLRRRANLPLGAPCRRKALSGLPGEAGARACAGRRAWACGQGWQRCHGGALGGHQYPAFRVYGVLCLASGLSLILPVCGCTGVPSHMWVVFLKCQSLKSQNLKSRSF